MVSVAFFRLLLVVKPPTELHGDLAWILIMGAAEGQAVVEEESAVGNVQGIDGDGETLAEVLAQRHVERSVTR